MLKYTEGLVDQTFLDSFETKVFKIKIHELVYREIKAPAQKIYFNMMFNLVFSGKLHFKNNIAQEDIQQLSFK